MKFADEIKQYGVKIKADRMDALMMDIFGEMFGDMLLERIGYIPMDALRYCAVVRYKSKAPQLPDEIILRRLANIRKQGRK